jgi:replicative DNA helicase
MIEVESALIGAVILDPSTLDRIGGTVSPSDFTDKDLGKMFGLLVDMFAAGEPVADPLVVSQRLREAGILEHIGGVSGFAKIAASCPSAHNASAYASSVATAANRRRLVSLGQELSMRASDETADPSKVTEWLDAQLSRTRSHRSQGSQTLGRAMIEALSELGAAQQRGSSTSVSTGLYRLDEGIGGLYPGELIILAARPSIGKSAMGAQIAASNAQRNRPVLFVSLEMTGRDLALRALAGHLNCDVRQIRSGRMRPDEWDRANNHADSIANEPFHLWTSRRATTAKIRAAARVQRSTGGLDLLVVDYIGLIAAEDPRKPRWEQISQASSDFKSLAMELQIPVLLLCQLGRAAEKEVPRLDHLRDSGSIEQDADVVLLLHRESRDSEIATLDIAKNRNGCTGQLSLGFEPGRVQFTDAPEWRP